MYSSIVAGSIDPIARTVRTSALQVTCPAFSLASNGLVERGWGRSHPCGCDRSQVKVAVKCKEAGRSMLFPGCCCSAAEPGWVYHTTQDHPMIRDLAVAALYGVERSLIT